MGWATTIPEIRRGGLRLVRPGGKWGNGVGQIAWRNRKGEEFQDEELAGKKVFGLTPTETSALFVAPAYLTVITPKQMAVKIERFVQNRTRKR